MLASAVKEDFPQPVMVVNKPGAAGVVGTMTARMSRPDGYTLLAGRVANNAIIPALNKTLKYTRDDFICLGLLDLNPLVFVVHKDAPYSTLRDLAEDIKAHPGAISFSTAGALNIQEVAAYTLLSAVGVDKNGAVSVPFLSDAAGKNVILGKRVVFGALNLSAVQDQLQEGGNLRALAVTTAARLLSILLCLTSLGKAFRNAGERRPLPWRDIRRVAFALLLIFWPFINEAASCSTPCFFRNTCRSSTPFISGSSSARACCSSRAFSASATSPS